MHGPMSNNKNLLKLLEVLPTLSKSDLKTLRAAIDTLSKEEGTSDATEMVFNAILRVIGTHMPYAEARRNRAFSAWQGNADSLVAFINVTWPEALRSKVVRQALVSFLVTMLVEDMRQRLIPISIGTVMVNLRSAVATFDKNFPGYRGSGMAKLVLAKMKTSKRT